MRSVLSRLIRLEALLPRPGEPALPAALARLVPEVREAAPELHLGEQGHERVLSRAARKSASVSVWLANVEGRRRRTRLAKKKSIWGSEDGKASAGDVLLTSRTGRPGRGVRRLT